MIKCGDDCIECCDFCIHATHEEFESNGRIVTGEPIGCGLHTDQEHQDIADNDGCCDDFHCFLAKEE